MADNQNRSAQIPEEYYTLTLYELTRSFGVSVETIVEIVEEGIITIAEPKQEKWIFDRQDVSRIRTAIHLHRDLGINYPGAALIVELLDEIERLRLKREQ